jgi:alanine racemase
MWERQRAWVEIDLAALAHNVRAIKQIISPSVAIMAIVKADAYGHGAIDVARTVLDAGASWLAVATVPEGIELRQHQISAPIMVLGPIDRDSQVRAVVEWQLQPTLVSIEQAIEIDRLSREMSAPSPLKVHLKLDTGMSRLGVDWRQAVAFVDKVSALSQLEIASIYSHFATADDIDRTVMEMQAARFKQSIAAISAAGYALPPLHLANSAGILQDNNFHYQIVRPGLILYGLYPAPHLKPNIDLQPVLAVKARIDLVKSIEPGTGVSYGYKYIADRPLKIATIGIGYADGVARRLSNRMRVSLRGKLVPQIGAITMDRSILDVSDIENPQVGEIVTILGTDGDNHIGADDWAETLDTISWEILSGFKHRLPRVKSCRLIY